MTASLPGNKSPPEYLSTRLSNLVILQLVGIGFIISFSNGILAVALPQIATDVDLQQNMLLWPSSAGYLATGTFLLLGGAISDVAGPKLVNLIGCANLTASTIAVGLSTRGIEMIFFRVWQGIAFALAYPPATAILSHHVRPGPPRNVGFSCIAFAMVLGFAAGMLVGAVGWRAGHYAAAAIGVALLILGVFALPADSKTLAELPI